MKKFTTHVDRHLVREAQGQDPDAAVDVEQALVGDLLEEELEAK